MGREFDVIELLSDDYTKEWTKEEKLAILDTLVWDAAIPMGRKQELSSLVTELEEEERKQKGS